MRRTALIVLVAAPLLTLIGADIGNAAINAPVAAPAQPPSLKNSRSNSPSCQTGEVTRQIQQKLVKWSHSPNPDASDDVDWEAIGRMTRRSAKQAREQYEAAVDKYLANPRPLRIQVMPTTVSGPARAEEITRTFRITVVPGVLSLEATVTVNTSTMNARTSVAATLFGYRIASSNFSISLSNPSFEIHPSFLNLVKADLIIGLYGNRLCLGVQGQACIRKIRVWPPGWRWACQSINSQNLFCILP